MWKHSHMARGTLTRDSWTSLNTWSFLLAITWTLSTRDY